MKAHLSRLLLISIITICVASAQSNKAASSPPPIPSQPADEIRSLTKALAGTWSTTEKYEPLFLTPNGGTGAGEQVFRAGPGGFTLLENYHTKTTAGELFGFGLLWWDQGKGLQHMWCINVYPTGCEMFPPPPQAGPKWDGKQLVIYIEQEQQGQKMIWHEVITDISPNAYTQFIDIGDAPDHMQRWLTMHAKRVTNAPSKSGMRKSE